MDPMLGDIFEDLDDEDENDDQEDHIDEIMNVLVDELLLGLCFEAHRACKMGTFLLEDTEDNEQRNYEIKEIKGLDVFGQVPMRKQYDCVCPNCSRNLAASRFAPHLEKCMGMGRNSSRIASRRIANTGNREGENDSDYNEDNEWNFTPEKKTKKSKKDKNSKKSKSAKNKSGVNTGDIPSVGSTASDGSGSQPSYETMSFDERKAVLMQTCGVISEHTKKMCTRTGRCPQHSDEQRRAVRLFLLTHQGAILDDDVIDIDTYDDGENLRDTLQWEAASNPSPTDSTSTTHSTSSKKRKIGKHSKMSSKKTSKHDKSENVHGSSDKTGGDNHSNRTTPTPYDF